MRAQISAPSVLLLFLEQVLEPSLDEILGRAADGVLELRELGRRTPHVALERHDEEALPVEQPAEPVPPFGGGPALRPHAELVVETPLEARRSRHAEVDLRRAQEEPVLPDRAVLHPERGREVLELEVGRKPDELADDGEDLPLRDLGPA